MSIRIRRIPGSLCTGPTDLSIPYPHGGVDLGSVRDMVWRPQAKRRPITAEEWGNQLIDSIFLGESVVFGVVFRDLNDDAWIETVFPGAAPGASGRALITGDPVDGVRAGTLESTRAVSLFFSPDAYQQHDAILLYAALPLVEDTAELQVSIGQEIGVAAMFMGIPSSAHSNLTHQVGKTGDLTL